MIDIIDNVEIIDALQAFMAEITGLEDELATGEVA